MDKISVIVPAYNAEKTIDKCLETLVNQTYENMEIIVIDDGSKDSSLKIMKKYKKKYPEKIVIISRENRGIGYTRNEGIKIATGKYLGFIDSDDYVEYDMYEKLYNHLKKTKSDIVVCDYYEFGDFGKRRKDIANFDVTNLYETPELINKVNTAPWNKLYKKEIFDNIEYPEKLKYEDLNTILFALLNAKKISKLNEPLVNYYINIIGETNTIDYRLFDIYEILEQIVNKFPKDNKKINKELLILTYNKVFIYIASLFAVNDRELMLRYYDRGIDFLNKHFKNWRIKYIKDSEGLKDLAVRLLRTNKSLYKTFIKYKVKKTKKKLLFTNYFLEIGGVETALVNLLNSMDFSKYDITLLLQHKRGEFLENLDKRVKVETFNLNYSNCVLWRKAINMVKIYYTVLQHFNKYDFSANFGNGYKASSLAAYYASKNNATWMHTNIKVFLSNKYSLFNDEKKLIKRIDLFFKNCKFRNFKHIMFVSKDAMNAYLSLYPEDKDKCHLCYNFIDYNKILKKSKEKTAIKKDSKKINLVHVGRHTEYDKKITRIINAVDILRKKYDICLYLVGDGPDHQLLVNSVKEKKLEKYVKFLGAKANPYPYFLLGDALVLSSAFEGFPTVYTEALTLNIPIITTDVSDAKSFIDNNYGIVCENNDEDIVNAIEIFIKNNLKITNFFDPQQFNNQSMNVIERLINK